MANKRLNAVITIGGAVSSTLGAAFGSITRETTKVGAAIQKLKDRQRELNAELAKAGRDGVRGNQLRLQYAQQELATIGKQLSALQRREALEKRIADNQAHRAKLRGQIGDTVAMGAAVLLPSAASVKRAADFNYQLQAIGNTADMDRAQIAQLGVEILRISDETAKSAQTVQGAMGFLVAAGMDVGKASAVLRPVGRTATATAAEIEDVARATFTLNDALKIQPAGMQRALDMLVQSGKEGNFEFKDMAAELPVLAAGMQALKMTGGEAVATLGAALQIARKGAGSSGQAATNVENFLAKVMSPETLKKAQKNFGVDLYKIISTAQKNGENPFEAAIAAISKMTKGGDQKLLGDLFQDMQVQNFLRPMLQNLAEYKKIKDKALAADGVVDRDFAKMMATQKVQLDEFGNAAGRAAIAVGNALAPAVGAVLSVLTPVVRGITSLVETFPKVTGGALLVVGGLLTLRTTVLVGSFAWTFMKGAMLAMAPVWTAAATGIRLVGSALMFAGKALLWLGRALLLNPIGLAITAIAGAAFLIYKNWEPLKAFFSGLWDGIKTTFATVYDWIVGKIGFLLELPGRIKDKVAGVLGAGAADSGTADTMGDMASAVLPAVPPMATARGGSQVQDNSQNTYHFQLPPGADPKALADEIERRQRARAGVRMRSSLVDGVGAQ